MLQPGAVLARRKYLVCKMPDGQQGKDSATGHPHDKNSRLQILRLVYQFLKEVVERGARIIGEPRVYG